MVASSAVVSGATVPAGMGLAATAPAATAPAATAPAATAPAPCRTFDPREFRAALGTFATGVTVITARAADGTPVGVTANSFNSVSLDPPMVLWSLAKKAYSLPVFLQATHWAVHVLGADQEELSNRFARAGDDKFRGLALDFSDQGVPLLAGCTARFECGTRFRHEGGDHVILVGEVHRFERAEKAPLVFLAGRYAQASSRASCAPRRAGGFNEDLLGYLLARAHHQFHTGIRAELREAGLTDAAWSAVAALTVRDGLGVEELQQALRHGVAEPLAPVLAQLVADGWLHTDPQGRGRECSFWLTRAGRERSLRLLALAQSRENDLLGRLGCTDGAALKALLRRFVALTHEGPDLWEGLPA